MPWIQKQSTCCKRCRRRTPPSHRSCGSCCTASSRKRCCGCSSPTRPQPCSTSSRISLPSGRKPRQKIPNAILQDMRIVPDVEGYDELLDKLTFAFMDGELPTEETIRKFAEPYSPPAPPPPVIVRRSRTVKRVTEPKKAKGRKAAKTVPAAQNGDLSLAAAGEVSARRRWPNRMEWRAESKICCSKGQRESRRQGGC